jgi:hypothetical protein
MISFIRCLNFAIHLGTQANWMTNPPFLITELLVVVGGLSRIIFMASVRGAYQGCLLRR